MVIQRAARLPFMVPQIGDVSKASPKLPVAEVGEAVVKTTKAFNSLLDSPTQKQIPRSITVVEV